MKSVDFNEILVRCLEDALTEVLGRTVANAMFVQMWEHYDITREEVPYRLETFFSILEGAFGYKGSRVLSRAIARKLYASLSIEFVETPEKRLTDYVEEAKKMLANKNKTDRNTPSRDE